jgi:hypothetical protein
MTPERFEEIRLAFDALIDSSPANPVDDLDR